MMVRVRGNPAPLAARVPTMAAGVDAGLYVQDAQPLDAWVGRRNTALIVTLGALAAITLLALFLSALGIFSLMSVSVSRRTREIGLRAALGADQRHVLAEVLSRALVLVGCGIAAGGALLLPFVVQWDEGIAYYAGSFGITAAVMLAACLLACIGPARRALRINPIDALREA
jgi:ABC-type antimicrobial peptide transport system permease subunit